MGKRVRVKVMREVEMVKDVGRAALEDRLTESPKKEKVPLRKYSLEEATSDDSGLLAEEGFLEDLLDGVVDCDIKQEKLSLSELLMRILDHLAVLDRGGMFKEPVDLEETPDYLACIANPMDFSTMRKKVEAEEYSSIEAFEEDFLLVVSNCLTSTNSTTALDSDNSATGSEFAVPTAPRRKSSRPGGPKRPEIVQPMEGEFTGRRQSQRSYGGEKPFMCNHCPLTFSNNDSKVGHERTHTEKKLECPFCEMRFGADISLRKHSKIHERQLASETM